MGSRPGRHWRGCCQCASLSLPVATSGQLAGSPGPSRQRTGSLQEPGSHGQLPGPRRQVAGPMWVRPLAARPGDCERPASRLRAREVACRLGHGSPIDRAASSKQTIGSAWSGVTVPVSLASGGRIERRLRRPGRGSAPSRPGTGALRQSTRRLSPATRTRSPVVRTRTRSPLLSPLVLVLSTGHSGSAGEIATGTDWGSHVNWPQCQWLTRTPSRTQVSRD
jgi:hypothetical protein